MTAIRNIWRDKYPKIRNKKMNAILVPLQYFLPCTEWLRSFDPVAVWMEAVRPSKLGQTASTKNGQCKDKQTGRWFSQAAIAMQGENSPITETYS